MKKILTILSMLMFVLVSTEAETLQEVNKDINALAILSKPEVLKLVTDKNVKYIIGEKVIEFTHKNDGVLKGYIPKRDKTFYGKWWVKKNGVLCKKTNKKRCSLIAKSKAGNYYAYIHKKRVVFAKIIIK